MKITLPKIISLTLALVFIAPAAWADQVYKSAMFGFSADQLVAQIREAKRVDIAGGSAVLYCQSEIDIAGLAGRTNCYDKGRNSELVSLTEQALAAMRFRPAEVDGEKVPVRMSYRIGFNQATDQLAALLIPNLGSMQERYGRDYIAPQERLDVSDWYERYNEDSWVNGEVFLGEGPLSRVATTVDENGKTDVVRTIDVERAYKRDANIVKNALKKSRFIPGFVDGRPVPMGYLAVVNYGAESGEAVSKR